MAFLVYVAEVCVTQCDTEVVVVGAVQIHRLAVVLHSLIVISSGVVYCTQICVIYGLSGIATEGVFAGQSKAEGAIRTFLITDAEVYVAESVE